MKRSVYSVRRENPTFSSSCIESLWRCSSIFCLVHSSLVSFRFLSKVDTCSFKIDACPSRWHFLSLSFSISAFTFFNSSCKLDRKRNEYELCMRKKNKEYHQNGVLERGNIWLATYLLSLTVISVDLPFGFLTSSRWWWLNRTSGPLMTRTCVFERVCMSCFGGRHPWILLQLTFFLLFQLYSRFNP